MLLNDGYGVPDLNAACRLPKAPCEELVYFIGNFYVYMERHYTGTKKGSRLSPILLKTYSVRQYVPGSNSESYVPGSVFPATTDGLKAARLLAKTLDAERTNA